MEHVFGHASLYYSSPTLVAGLQCTNGPTCARAEMRKLWEVNAPNAVRRVETEFGSIALQEKFPNSQKGYTVKTILITHVY